MAVTNQLSTQVIDGKEQDVGLGGFGGTHFRAVGDNHKGYSRRGPLNAQGFSFIHNAEHSEDTVDSVCVFS